MLTSSPPADARWRSDAQPESSCPLAGPAEGPSGDVVVLLGVERALGIGHRLVEVDEIGLARRRRLLGLAELGRVGSFQAERRLVAFVLFKQRIAFELALDVLRQLDVRQLQQTDGLLQLWCHHQLLALSELQLCRKRHARVQCLGYGCAYCLVSAR